MWVNGWDECLKVDGSSTCLVYPDMISGISVSGTWPHWAVPLPHFLNCMFSLNLMDLDFIRINMKMEVTHLLKDVFLKGLYQFGLSASTLTSCFFSLGAPHQQPSLQQRNLQWFQLRNKQQPRRCEHEKRRTPGRVQLGLHYCTVIRSSTGFYL